MRPTVGQILSGMALGAVATAMLVAPERVLVMQEPPAPRLELAVPDERRVVHAAPIPLGTRVTVTRKARPAPATASTISRALAPPAAPPPPARRVAPPPPPVAAPPPARASALEVASREPRDDEDDDRDEDEDDDQDDDEADDGDSGDSDDDDDEDGEGDEH